MMQATAPRFEWGQRVQTVTDLFNDGSFPQQPLDALLVQGGETGEIVQVGQHTDSGTIVYMVEFSANRVVGCFETELALSQSNGGAL
jgi:nitrogen fixation protein NifZ